MLRAFNGEGGGTRWLEQALGRQRASGAQSIRLAALSGVLNGWAVQAVFAALLVAGALWLDERLGGVAAQGMGMGMEAAIPVIVALLLACRHVDPLLEVAGYADSLRAARVQLDAVRDILAVQPLPEPAVPQAPRDASVELRDVVFRYAPGQPEVLRGLSLRVEPGSMTALVGPRALASRPCCGWSHAFSMCSRAAFWWAASTCARSRASGWQGRSARSSRTATFSRAPLPTTSAWAARRPAMPR